MDREALKSLLPHREPMLLLDESEVVDACARGRYTVRGDEFFLQGHFPDNPVVPGVILCEMLAQNCCVLLEGKATGDTTPYYTGLDKVRFKRPVHPGDTIDLICQIDRAREPFYFASGKALVNDELCVSANFSFALIPATPQDA